MKRRKRNANNKKLRCRYIVRSKNTLIVGVIRRNDEKETKNERYQQNISRRFMYKQKKNVRFSSEKKNYYEDE